MPRMRIHIVHHILFLWLLLAAFQRHITINSGAQAVNSGKQYEFLLSTPPLPINPAHFLLLLSGLILLSSHKELLCISDSLNRKQIRFLTIYNGITESFPQLISRSALQSTAQDLQLSMF